MSMRLKWMKIEKYRNVKPGTHLTFNERFNVPLGPNGSGKTTLLDLVAMAVSGDFSRLKQDDFSIEYGATWDERELEVALSNSGHPSAGGLAALRERPGRHRLEWRVQVRATGGKILSDVRCANGTVVMSTGDRGEVEAEKMDPDAPFGWGWLLLSMATVWSPPIRELQECVRLDEGLDVFRTLLGGAAISSVTPCLEVSATSDGVAIFMPAEVAERVAGLVREMVKPNDMVLADSRLPAFLTRALALLGLDSATMTLPLIESVPGPEGPVHRFSGVEFRFARGEWEFREALLSYGQKRLLTFFYYSACMPHVVIADELVNGMHHSWIRACVEEIGERQAFLTSQNALLLDHIPINTVEDAQNTFILCKKVGGQLQWENLGKEEATELHAAAQLGIRQLGEILITQGLW